jgi:hypothetical protein
MRCACSQCGAISGQRKCPRHRVPLAAPGQRGHGRAGNRDRAAQARFRRALIAATGLVCQGCGRTDVPLQAHHTSATTGLLLCDDCHADRDDHARPTRASAP